MSRVQTKAYFRPFALPGLVAAIALAATGHPWWELLAFWVGTMDIKVSVR